MKVKILKSSGWYEHFVDSEFKIDKYDKDHPRLRFCVDETGWVYESDCVITELPESFCVKKCDDVEKWNKYIKWLNKTYLACFNGICWSYYGVECYHVRNRDEPFGTEIHIDDMIKHIEYMETKDSITVKYENGKFIEVKEEINMETQKLSRQGLKEIHSIACSNWKVVLERYGANSPLEDYIELTQEQVNNMFYACNIEQLPIVSKYLKQDDGSVDVTKYTLGKHGFCDTNYYIIRDREQGKYKQKSFLLSDNFDWKIEKDEVGQLCLIPTKKK